MKLLVPASAVTLATALIIGLQSGSNHLASPAGVSMTSAKTAPGIFAPGRIEGATPEIELRPALMGRVANIAVKEGQWVNKDDLLLCTTQSEYVAAVHLAEAQLRAAEAEHSRLLAGSHEEERKHAASNLDAKLAQFQQAQRTWQRFSQLSTGGAVTLQDTDLRQSELRVLEAEVAAAEARCRLLNAPPRPEELSISQANVEAARARREIARSRLADTQLRAPINGQVLRIDVHEGEVISPNSPTPAATMADCSQLRVRAFIDEYDAMRLCLGAPATITVDGLAGREFRGRVVEVSPLMRRKPLRTHQPAERLDTETREVLIALEASLELVIGLRVDVLITQPTELRHE